MPRNAVTLLLYSAVFALAVIFTIVNINVARADSDDKGSSWETSSLNDIHAVRGMIYAWIQARESKNFDNYMSYYSPQFRSEKLDYNDWRAKKSDLFKRPGDISLKISNLLISIEGEDAKADFVQEYSDAYLSEVGEKHIKLIKVNNTWKIVSEQWKPMNK
ncbi:MAG: hypothetical protein ISS65_06065 [Desulfobacterales bacterium]|uniref:Cds6 C-terminal domain-containing protein n=1 Tax=Candidatus Desulfatibia profunda TaxID=2841695 RepID=A0A8J6NM90_9BACT|nr:hypothetical protein [Candidatus Desulfatibia profunda]MBL7179759.1 hypothetical protein [Desulfobacterales bacterium]